VQQNSIVNRWTKLILSGKIARERSPSVGCFHV